MASTEWLSTVWVSLTKLHYPISTPVRTFAFHDKQFFTTGPWDLLTVVVAMAVMAVLRDVLRIWVFEPFAEWKLKRDLYSRKRAAVAAKNAKAKGKATNGHANGSANGHANGHSNGSANGHANGHSNGHTNGHVNGSANGYTNGHSNGYTNGSPVPKPTKKELALVHRSVLRFAEQGWSVVYSTFSWNYGFYVHRHAPTDFANLKTLWIDYPHTPLPGPIKFYYLMQTAFYTHQILILNAEARRKDHWQMMFHHVITVALLWLSYYTNFTRVGCVVMLLMDWCDIFLPLAKMMRYIAIPQIYTDATFGFFMVSWLITRHILFVLIVYSVLVHLPQEVQFNYDPSKGLFLSEGAWWVFSSLLSALEVLQCIWFWMICRVAWRVVTGNGAADERSDEEVDADDLTDSSKEN